MVSMPFSFSASTTRWKPSVSARSVGDRSVVARVSMSLLSSWNLELFRLGGPSSRGPHPSPARVFIGALDGPYIHQAGILGTPPRRTRGENFLLRPQPAGEPRAAAGNAAGAADSRRSTPLRRCRNGSRPRAGRWRRARLSFRRMFDGGNGLWQPAAQPADNARKLIGFSLQPHPAKLLHLIAQPQSIVAITRRTA